MPGIERNGDEVILPGDLVIELTEDRNGVRVYTTSFAESSCPDCGHPLERGCFCPCCMSAAEAFWAEQEKS